MTKKIVWGIVLFGLIGILVAGAVVRTAAKTGETAGTRGGTAGAAGTRSTPALRMQGRRNCPAGRNGPARGGGYGDGSGTGRRQGARCRREWLTSRGASSAWTRMRWWCRRPQESRVTVENRPWSFALEQGLAARPVTR